MNEIPSPGYYRLFQKVALAIGLVTALLGYFIQNSAVGGAGLVILVHALVTTLTLSCSNVAGGWGGCRTLQALTTREIELISTSLNVRSVFRTEAAKAVSELQ